MKSKKYIEFKTEYFPKIQTDYWEKTIPGLLENYEKYSGILQRQMEHVLKNIVSLQGQVPVEIGCIQISVLISSISTGNPELMYEVYDSGMDFGKLLLAQTETASWLFQYWDAMQQDIEKKVIELNWQKYLGIEEQKALLYELTEGVMLIFTFVFKYFYERFPAFQNAGKILKSEDFYVSLGEYRGFKKLVYQEPVPKDIFQTFSRKDFSFMKFENLKYEKKRFIGQNLQNARFHHCYFINTDFQDVDFRDGDFLECVFRECVFKNCILSGCKFTACDIQRVEWTDNDFTSGILMEDGMVKDFCRVVVFDRSILHKNIFSGKVSEECLFMDCDTEEVEEG